MRSDCQSAFLVTILVDDPIWPAHGRHWAHLVSDESLFELHDFAIALSIPRRGFDRDHYDIPAEYVSVAVDLGATKVGTKELLIRLVGSGLRVLVGSGLRVRRSSRLELEVSRSLDYVVAINDSI